MNILLALLILTLMACQSEPPVNSAPTAEENAERAPQPTCESITQRYSTCNDTNSQAASLDIRRSTCLTIATHAPNELNNLAQCLEYDQSCSAFLSCTEKNYRSALNTALPSVITPLIERRVFSIQQNPLGHVCLDLIQHDKVDPSTLQNTCIPWIVGAIDADTDGPFAEYCRSTSIIQARTPSEIQDACTQFVLADIDREAQRGGTHADPSHHRSRCTRIVNHDVTASPAMTQSCTQYMVASINRETRGDIFEGPKAQFHIACPHMLDADPPLATPIRVACKDYLDTRSNGLEAKIISRRDHATTETSQDLCYVLPSAQSIGKKTRKTLTKACAELKFAIRAAKGIAAAKDAVATQSLTIPKHCQLQADLKKTKTPFTKATFDTVLERCYIPIGKSIADTLRVELASAEHVLTCPFELRTFLDYYRAHDLGGRDRKLDKKLAAAIAASHGQCRF